MNSVQIVPRHRAVPVEPELRGPFVALGRAVVRRRGRVLAAFGLGVIAAGVLGAQVFAALQTAGYDDPGSESARADAVLTDSFGVREPLLALAVEIPQGIDDPGGAAAATAVVDDLRSTPGITSVVSYWTSGRPEALRGSDDRTGEVLVYSDLTDASDQTALAHDVVAAYGGSRDGVTVFVGGFAAVGDAITGNITADLAKAEAIAVPLTLVLLILVFGSLVAAGLPFTVALGSIVGSFAVVWLVTLTTDVSVFALNLVTGLGLGLGIDYALLIVNRFREELAAGHEPGGAVVRTVATAGRTVAVSGATVAVVLAALLFFPQYFLRSFGYAGIAVTVLAVVSALSALPAVLALVGHRVDRFRVRRGDLAPRDDGAWSRVARFVMARPWPVLLAAGSVLVVLALPALSVSFSQVDARALPSSDPAAQASAVLDDRFDGNEGSPTEVIVLDAASDAAGVQQYAARLSRLPGVVRVVAPSAVVVAGEAVTDNPQPGGYVAGKDVRLRVVTDVEPRSVQGQALTGDIRAIDAPGQRLVGGASAVYTDAQQAIATRGVWALVWVALATLVVLFLYTGSVLLPIKAVVLNVLSLGATVGMLTWVFQEGHLRWLVGDFTVTGSIDTAMAVLIAVVAFALSMDYEVFLLSRIKEEHDAGRGTTEAVALGLQRSGRIITAAAVLLAVVFISFVSSGVTNIKQLGLGVAFAIVLDATVVRGLLVPALMKVAGRWNWWAPAPLVELHRRFGVSDG